MSELRNCASQKRSIRIKKRLEKLQTKQKENGFVLDCLNSTKSNLKSYTSINDKFLRYFIIKVRPNHKKDKTRELRSVEKEEEKNHMMFQDMIRQQKERLREMEELKNVAKTATGKSGSDGNDWINQVEEKEEMEEMEELEEVQEGLDGLQLSSGL